VARRAAVTGHVLSRLTFALVQFLPLSLFATYAFWHGQPTNERWVNAFTFGAMAAAIQLLIVLPQRRPVNRLILGANLYLLVGGAAAIAHQWWLLNFYARLNESGIFLFMLGVGIAATFASPAGFVGVAEAERRIVRRYSVWLLAATFAAALASIAFQGNRTWSAVVPLIGLAVLQRSLVRRVSHASSDGGMLPAR
jgi:hypothetical protein